MNKNIRFILIGFVIFLLGYICLQIETKDYLESNKLTSNFVMEQETLSYSIDDNKYFRITNNERNTNINLYIDNKLKDEVKIVVSYPNFNVVEYDYSVTNLDNIKLIQIDFNSSSSLNMSDISDILQLGIKSLKDKVKYNYDLLIEPLVKIYVHEDYKENIQFVGKYGKVYNPIR